MNDTDTIFDDKTWRRLIASVFHPTPEENRLILLVDLPDDKVGDNDDWKDRRQLASQWLHSLSSAFSADELQVELWLYRNARTNNGDLPGEAWAWQSNRFSLPDHVRELAEQTPTPLNELLGSCPLFIAMTELSATAPLKVASKRHGFRAATMPGFSRGMMAALGLDFDEIDSRCQLLKALLDQATSADFVFLANGERHQLKLDLRHRQAHASSGLLKNPSTAGNLPSGETYIVPYEGEIDGDLSRSQGSLPVDLDGELVIYSIVDNKAVDISGNGPQSVQERQVLKAEPAYANIAELGLGVLGEMGVEPVGEILLDEKLGLHIAFGRSDHFGGMVGPSDFSSADAVVHIDRVFLPDPAALVKVPSVTLTHSDGRTVFLMAHGRYQIDFGRSAEEIWQ